MFLTSFYVYFVFGYACFISICLKTAIWIFPAFLEQGLAIFGEDRLATLSHAIIMDKSVRIAAFQARRY